MEREGSWEQNALVNELIEGMEIARKLKAELSLLPSSVDTSDLLVQRMLSCYDKALLILKWKPSVSKSQAQTTKHQSVKHHSKKRQMKPKLIDRVRVKTENGKGPYEDGYNWRKYGNKEILGAKYPRSYYRCTLRKTKGCWATKQVQRSDEDPTILDITYQGEHTCSQGNNSLLPPKSSDTQEIISMGNIEETASYPFTSFGCMPAAQDNNTLLSSVSQMQLLSPQTPESHHFPSSSSSFIIDELDHHGIGVSTKLGPDSDTTEIISANTSATDPPIFDFNFDFNFSLDALKIDSDFPNDCA